MAHESLEVRRRLAGGLTGVRADTQRQGDVRQLIAFSIAAVPMGVIGALSAWLLYHLINIITGLAFYGRFTLQSPIYPPTQGLGIRALIIPVVGALIVGVMARYGTDRIRGHGIPEAMEAVLTQESRVSSRVAIFKPISAAFAVGSGGPFGAEGPIIQTGGAIGSLLGQAFHLTASERRILLACGAAAGMVGIFNTPLAAVALALELLLFEFRARSLVPVVIASAVAAGCRTFLLGSAVMFHVQAPITLGSPVNLLWLVPLGLIVGVAAVIVSKSLYRVEEFFDRLKVSILFKPALGAAVLGVVALFEPRVLGMGYTIITNILNGGYSDPTLALLAIGKAVALIFSLGAGTSGGLLAPMLLIGAAIGVGYGRALAFFFPGLGLSPALCGVVSMSGLFSSAARAPLTSFLFAFELTGNSTAIVPLMIGCMVADLTARALMQESVMTERLVRRGLRITQDLELDKIASLPVRAVMGPAVATLAAATPLSEALRLLAGDAERASGGLPRQQWTFPVVETDGSLAGIVTRGDLLDAATHAEHLGRPVVEVATRDVAVVGPDDALSDALERLTTGDFAMLPVISSGDRRVIGTLSRSDALRASLVAQEQETRRQRFFGAERQRGEPVTAD